MPIWDDLKQYWQLNGVGLPKRTGVNVVGNVFGSDGQDRLNLTFPQQSPHYVYAINPGPNISDAVDELWVAPFGIYQALGTTLPTNAIYTPINERTYLDSISFHHVSTPYNVDTIQIDIVSDAFLPGELSLTIPPGTTTSNFTFFKTLPKPKVLEPGNIIGCRVRQSGNEVVASWNAYVVVC